MFKILNTFSWVFFSFFTENVEEVNLRNKLSHFCCSQVLSNIAATVCSVENQGLNIIVRGKLEAQVIHKLNFLT